MEDMMIWWSIASSWLHLTRTKRKGQEGTEKAQNSIERVPRRFCWERLFTRISESNQSMSLSRNVILLFCLCLALAHSFRYLIKRAQWAPQAPSPHSTTANKNLVCASMCASLHKCAHILNTYYTHTHTHTHTLHTTLHTHKCQHTHATIHAFWKHTKRTLNAHYTYTTTTRTYKHINTHANTNTHTHTSHITRHPSQIT